MQKKRALTTMRRGADVASPPRRTSSDGKEGGRTKGSPQKTVRSTFRRGSWRERNLPISNPGHGGGEGARVLEYLEGDR